MLVFSVWVCTPPPQSPPFFARAMKKIRMLFQRWMLASKPAKHYNQDKQATPSLPPSAPAFKRTRERKKHTKSRRKITKKTKRKRNKKHRRLSLSHAADVTVSPAGHQRRILGHIPEMQRPSRGLRRVAPAPPERAPAQRLDTCLVQITGEIYTCWGGRNRWLGR